MKIFYFSLIIALFSGCATTTSTSTITEETKETINIDGSPFLRMKWAHKVAFNAYMDPAKVSGNNSGPGFYDGSAGVAGVLAQVLIYSAINNSAQKNKYNTAQEMMNKSLSPYQDKLNAFVHSDLWEAVKSKELGFKTFQEGDNSGVTLYEATPEFILSPDEKAIMLVNQVKVFKSDNIEKPIYTNNFFVVSEPLANDDIASYWNDESSSKFVEVGSTLFADSIELALKDFNQELETTNEKKTFRYLFGQKKMYEHGQLINSSCNSVVMKNLRKFIYKVPATEPAYDCEHANKNT